MRTLSIYKVGLVVLAAASAVAFDGRLASALPPSGTNQATWNICGYDASSPSDPGCPTILGSGAYASAIVDWVRSAPTRSASLMLNEVCYPLQYTILAYHLGSLGYSAHKRHMLDIGGGGANCEYIANAVVMSQDIVDSYDYVVGLVRGMFGVG